MKRYNKVYLQNYKGIKKYRWAIKMFMIAISMSLFFGFISQTLLSKMGAIIAILGICIFIFFSVVFDMLGIAVASCDQEFFEKCYEEGKKGASVGLLLCKHSEKMCSFCADVVGDICSTLCGAGGAAIVSTLVSNVYNETLVIFTTISVSALIAGLTIFFKAIMKERALKNSNKIILKLGVILEKTIYKEKIKKNTKNS